jgi:hypothetical protein
MKTFLIITTLIVASAATELALCRTDSPPCIRMASVMDLAGDCGR